MGGLVHCGVFAFLLRLSRALYNFRGKLWHARNGTTRMMQTPGRSLKKLCRKTQELLSLLHTTAEEELGVGGARTRFWHGSSRRQWRRGRGANEVFIFVNVSMGRCFPRSLGYRSRLGMGFIPIRGGGSAAVVDRRLCPKSTGECN